jgi:hypothetical protein
MFKKESKKLVYIWRKILNFKYFIKLNYKKKSLNHQFKQSIKMAARGSQSLQVKRKIYFRQEEEEVEEYCLITYLDEPGSHSICKKTKLFDLVNLSSGKDSASIMYENRQYKVLILRTGSKKLIKRLLEKYEDNESIKTADDSDATKKLG